MKCSYRNNGYRRRKIGEPRKSQSIYDNLGHPYNIENKEVIFIGKNEKAYSLTRNKKYKIIRANNGKFNYDADLYKKFEKVSDSRKKLSQGEDYFITIINDKGHKRKYSHMMFKKGE